MQPVILLSGSAFSGFSGRKTSLERDCIICEKIFLYNA
jgi:hypothetical protein